MADLQTLQLVLNVISPLLAVGIVYGRLDSKMSALIDVMKEHAVFIKENRDQITGHINDHLTNRIK